MAGWRRFQVQARLLLTYSAVLPSQFESRHVSGGGPSQEQHQKLPLQSLPKSSSAPFPPFPLHTLLQEMVLSRALTSLSQACFGFTSCRTRAHTSSSSFDSSPALPNSLRSAGRKVVAAAGEAWEGTALEGSRSM